LGARAGRAEGRIERDRVARRLARARRARRQVGEREEDVLELPGRQRPRVEEDLAERAVLAARGLVALLAQPVVDLERRRVALAHRDLAEAHVVAVAERVVAVAARALEDGDERRPVDDVALEQDLGEEGAAPLAAEATHLLEARRADLMRRGVAHRERELAELRR